MYDVHHAYSNNLSLIGGIVVNKLSLATLGAAGTAGSGGSCDGGDDGNCDRNCSLKATKSLGLVGRGGRCDEGKGEEGELVHDCFVLVTIV